MPSKIQILPDEIVNQIAAGEVVENPASVVKELVENSLDAEAKKIEVHIYGGGLQKISILDDGLGMSGEDLLCSLKRHATSKLRKFEDLLHLKTMGFRGEALASIGAVSKLQMESSLLDGSGSLLYAEGGKVLRQQVASRRRGTTVDVESLFYNVPARKRFQRSAKAAVAEIHRIMVKLALAYPSVQFSLYSSGSKMFEVEAADTLEKRVKDLFGEEFFAALLPLSFEDPLLCLQGFIGKPSFAKHTRSSQYLLINQRAVFSSLVDRSLREGYGTRLSEGYHPIFVLHMKLSSEKIDVNVHPQKREVRLCEELLLKKKIAEIISATLDHSLFAMPDLAPISMEESLRMQLPEENPLPFSRQPSFSFQETFSLGPKENALSFRPLKIIGSFYLVEFENPIPFLGNEKEHLAFIDLAGAYGRALFDRLEKALLKEELKICKERQSLLVPHLLEFSSEEILQVEEKLSLFTRLGWEVRILGKQTVAIDAIPPFIEEAEVFLLFSLILEELYSFGESEVQKKIFLKKMAEKFSAFARGRKKTYTSIEAQKLLAELFSCKDPGRDPLGRSIFAPLKSSHIQELFLEGEKNEKRIF